MCVIIDTNKLGDFAKVENITGDPVMDGLHRLRVWVKNGGKIVYFKPLPKTKEAARHRELQSNESARVVLMDLLRRGRAKLIDYSDCAQSAKKFAPKIKSDDPHILALAEVSGASVLCTSDRALMDDFGKHIKGGKIYPSSERAQKQMLSQSICP